MEFEISTFLPLNSSIRPKHESRDSGKNVSIHPKEFQSNRSIEIETTYLGEWHMKLYHRNIKVAQRTDSFCGCE